MPRVTLVDYGMGNILSVSRAFEQCGAMVTLTDDSVAIANADYLVLPGVGAFADGMSGLEDRGLIDPIKEFVAKERPFLGICLGMQMMLDESEEFGLNKGLGLIHGKIEAISPVGTDGGPHKIPNIGWNEICAPEGMSWDNSILRNIHKDTAFYFVHSYAAVPENDEHRLANCYYGGHRIAAVIRNENLYGCQFHPEKSGVEGLSILSTFLLL